MNMMLNSFIDAVRARAALHDETLATRAVCATLHELGRYLTPSQVSLVKASVPTEIAAYLSDSDPDVGPFYLDRFYQSIALLEETRVGVALEHAQAVCEVVASGMSEPERENLLKGLCSELRVLLTTREIPEVPRVIPPARLATEPRSLSSGRAGSSRPLSEAGPYAHQHSIAVEGKPSKPHPETLSTGIPRSRRPISGSH